MKAKIINTMRMTLTAHQTTVLTTHVR